MTILTGRTPAASYQNLLTISTVGGPGLVSALSPIQDGKGVASPLSLSIDAINIDRSASTFQLDSVAVTSTALNINSMAASDPIALGTGSLTLPAGTTAERPGTPVNGMTRYNSDLGYLESYESGAWVITGGGGTVVSITATGSTGLTIGGSPITTSGTLTFTLGAELQALSQLATLGLVSRTASATYTGRTIAGTTDRLDVTNGNGISGNPTLDISSTYVGQTSITTLGTVTTGIWNASAVTVPFGGTGLTTVAQGDLIFASATNTLLALAKDATATRYISNTGTSNNPAWAQIDLSNGVTGNLAVTNLDSGTAAGATTFWRGDGTWGTPVGSGVVDSVTGTADRITITGTAADPIVDIASTYVGQATITTLGTIATGVWSATAIGVTKGGTGLTGTTINQILYSSATDTIAGITAGNSSVLVSGATGVPSWATSLTDGQVILGSTGATPVAASITAGSGVTITPGAGTLEIAATGSGGTVTSVTSADANRITIAGTAADPTVDIAATYVGQTSITTLGTIATGVWSGTAIAETKGGTNQTTYTLGDTLYSSAANTLSKLTGNTTTTQKFLSQTGDGANSAAPTWEEVATSAGDSMKQDVVVTHAFSVGDWVYLNGTVWTLASNASAATAEKVGYISAISTTVSFTLQMGGYISTGLSGLTAGEVSFLSTGGAATTTEPTADGEISLPLFVAQSATTAIMLTYRGVEIGGTQTLGDFELITSTTASSDATVEFTDLSSTYVAYKILISGCTPATDGAILYMRTSTDNGTTYDSGAGNYAYGEIYTPMSAGGAAGAGSASATQMQLTSGMQGNIVDSETCDFEVTIFNPSATTYTVVRATGHMTTVTPVHYLWDMAGLRLSAADVDAVQLLFSTGNIAVGEFRLYGLKGA